MYAKFVKRFLDIVLSLIGLPFFAVIFVIVAPIIVLTDKGSVFYNAMRLGKNGTTYKMYKFRSMAMNASDIRNRDGSTYNGEDDTRVTRIGKILRKTSLDETPQILNVLKGDMSLIGPRPFLTTNYKGYDRLDDKGKKRLSVKPGITGYSQAYYRNSVSMAEKIDQDCYYAEHLSFSLDIKIFFHTLKSVVKRENIYVEDKKKEGVHK